MRKEELYTALVNIAKHVERSDIDLKRRPINEAGRYNQLAEVILAVLSGTPIRLQSWPTDSREAVSHKTMRRLLAQWLQDIDTGQAQGFTHGLATRFFEQMVCE